MNKIEIHPNLDFPHESKYEWIMYMNGVAQEINNFYFECPCYSALDTQGILPIIIILASEVVVTEELNKKLVNLK